MAPLNVQTLHWHFDLNKGKIHTQKTRKQYLFVDCCSVYCTTFGQTGNHCKPGSELN